MNDTFDPYDYPDASENSWSYTAMLAMYSLGIFVYALLLTGLLYKIPFMGTFVLAFAPYAGFGLQHIGAKGVAGGLILLASGLLMALQAYLAYRRIARMRDERSLRAPSAYQGVAKGLGVFSLVMMALGTAAFLLAGAVGMLAGIWEGGILAGYVLAPGYLLLPYVVLFVELKSLYLEKTQGVED